MGPVVYICICIGVAAASLSSPQYNPSLPDSNPRQLDGSDQLVFEKSNFTMTSTDRTTLDFTSSGSSALPGMNLLLLMTTFITNSNYTGQVWAIYEQDPEAPEMIIQGLNKPIGICVDSNNGYMYLIEQLTSEGNSAVYMYAVSWNSKEFTIDSGPVTVYEGPEPTDCEVDNYGNLYITDSTLDEISGISLADLKALNFNYFILYSSDKFSQVSYVAALDVDDDGNLYFINGKVEGNSGLINLASSDITVSNGASIETMVSDDMIGWSIAITDENLYYTANKQGVYGISLLNPGTPVLIADFTTPKGVCYADGSIFVADVNTASIYILSDELTNDPSPEVYLTLSNPYALECINTGILLTVCAGFMVLV